MKPPAFTYHRPASVEDALAVLAEVGEDGKVLAGGQSLVPMLNMRLAAPGHLVDINRLETLSYVRHDGASNTIRIGALARHAAVERDVDAYAVLPLLRQATANVAHPAIRNRGTSVGSLVHADPAAELPAVLSLVDGEVILATLDSRRTVPAADFFTGPLESAIRPGELAVEAVFPVPPPRTGSAWLEVSRRRGDYAVCGVGVLVTLDDGGRVSRARATYISVGPTPVTVELTDAVAGQVWDAADWAGAGALAAGAVDPEDDIHATGAYRRHLVGVLTARAAKAAAANVSEREPAAVPAAAAERSDGAAARTVAKTAPEAARGSERTRIIANGVPEKASVPARRLLSDFLRHDLGHTGTHVGCEHGVCGACTVLVDGEPMRSCLLFAVSVDGAEVTTVEGCRGPDNTLGPVQQAFHECHGLQCGFCTPGFITTITAYLRDHPEPTEDEAREAISGNLCRCTGYQNIVAAVVRAAELTREQKK